MSTGMLPLGHAMAERRFVRYNSIASVPGGVTDRTAIAARVARSRMHGRLYLCNTIIERLAQDLQDMAPELGPFIQAE